MSGFAGTMVFVWLVATFIAILWILLPFAVFGMKPLLRQAIQEQQRAARALNG